MSESSTGRIVRRSAIAIAFAAATMALPVTQANALTTSGSCSTSQGFFANVAVDYHNSAGWHYPDRYRWSLGVGGHRMGNKNNVRAEIRDTNLQVYNTWVSGDNVAKGAGSKTIAASVRVPGARQMYGQFQVVFDWVDHSDPRCAASTQRV